MREQRARSLDMHSNAATMCSETIACNIFVMETIMEPDRSCAMRLGVIESLCSLDEFIDD
jgi:hypothetical protein